MHYLTFLVYMGSVSLAALAVPNFMVISVAETILIIALACTVPLLVLAQLFGYSESLALAVGHVMVALVIHPAVTIREDDHISTERQVEMIELAVGKSSLSDDRRARLKRELAKSLSDDVTFSMKHRLPWLYWAFPPSVVLCCWAVIIYRYLPLVSRDSRRR